MICTPSSPDPDAGLGLAAQASEQQLQGAAQEAGRTRIRRATETPFSLVPEARP